MNIQIKLLYCDDCPSHEFVLPEMQQIIAQEGIDATIELVSVTTDEQAQRLHFVGSPTILVNGQDIVPPSPNSRYARTCRAYNLEDGRISPLPSQDTIRRALRAAKEE